MFLLHFRNLWKMSSTTWHTSSTNTESFMVHCHFLLTTRGHFLLTTRGHACAVAIVKTQVLSYFVFFVNYHNHGTPSTEHEHTEYSIWVRTKSHLRRSNRKWRDRKWPEVTLVTWMEMTSPEVTWLFPVLCFHVFPPPPVLFPVLFPISFSRIFFTYIFFL